MNANQKRPQSPCVCVTASVMYRLSLCTFMSICLYVKTGPLHLPATAVEQSLSSYSIQAQIQTNVSVFPHKPQVDATILT